MKFEDLKKGMKVKATCSECVYGVTNKENNWIGTVMQIYGDGTFSAKTISCTHRCTARKVFVDLNPGFFEPVEEEPTTAKQQEKELLRVTTCNKEIKIYYKDKFIAKAKCSKEDNYDEEFGLNLALRRFCKTLKDSHEVVITKTERIDDYL
jgi:hypothetical protein